MASAAKKSLNTLPGTNGSLRILLVVNNRHAASTTTVRISTAYSCEHYIFCFAYDNVSSSNNIFDTSLNNWEYRNAHAACLAGCCANSVLIRSVATIPRLSFPILISFVCILWPWSVSRPSKTKLRWGKTATKMAAPPPEEYTLAKNTQTSQY